MTEDPILLVLMEIRDALARLEDEAKFSNARLSALVKTIWAIANRLQRRTAYNG